MRTLVAILAGFLLAMFIAYGVEYINHFFWFPAGSNYFDTEQLKDIIPTLPPIAGVPNLIGSMAGVFLGTRLAVRKAGGSAMFPGYAIAGLILLQGAIIQMVVPQEWWVLAISAIALFVATYFGSRAGLKASAK